MQSSVMHPAILSYLIETVWRQLLHTFIRTLWKAETEVQL